MDESDELSLPSAIPHKSGTRVGCAPRISAGSGGSGAIEGGVTLTKNHHLAEMALPETPSSSAVPTPMRRHEAKNLRISGPLNATTVLQQSPHQGWDDCRLCKPNKHRANGEAARKRFSELRFLGRTRWVSRHELGISDFNQAPSGDNGFHKRGF